MSASPRAPVGGTARALTAGTVGSAICFVIGFCLTLAGADPGAGDPLDAGAIAASVAALRPWGWSMLGVLVLLATPAAGLIVSAVELRRPQPRTALLALAVLGVLTVAGVVALAAP